MARGWPAARAAKSKNGIVGSAAKAPAAPNVFRNFRRSLFMRNPSHIYSSFRNPV